MTAPTLTYGRADRSHRRFIVIAVVVAVVVTGFGMIYPKLDRLFTQDIPRLRAQRECLSFALPAGTVDYTEDRADATRLSGGQKVGPGWSTLSDGSAIWGFNRVLPDCWNRAFPEPPAWFALVGVPRAAVFLHARHAPGRPDRLVYVAIDNFFALRQGRPGVLASNSAMTANGFDWYVVQPGTLRTQAVLLQQGSWHGGDLDVATPDPLRLYAGQPEPDDPARFAVGCRAGRSVSTIEGRLGPDDRLTFIARPPGPADGPIP